jgi:signal peptidase I
LSVTTSAPTQTENASPGEPQGFFKGFLKEAIELIVVTLFLLVLIRWGIAEARYIPSSSMEPTLQINDRLIVEKISGHLGKKIERGDILVFYPPPIEMSGRDLSNDLLHLAGRYTGLPFFPNEPAFIKRVIGLPGDMIRIQAGQGVYINGQLLDESAYTKEIPNYNLNVLGDIKGRNMDMRLIQYETDPKKMNNPIIVPSGQLFMMGDNRNNSEDGHVWGFLPQQRVIGRAYLLIWRKLDPPRYPPSLQAQE